MLSLVPRWPTPAAVARAAVRGGGLNSIITALDRHWPVVWAGLALCACRLGEDSPRAAMGPEPEVWGRIAVLAAVGLAPRRPPFAVASWLLAAAAAFQCGAGTTARLDAAPSALAPAAWLASQRVETLVSAVVRVRARPRTSPGGRWSAPATMLRTVPRDSCHAPPPNAEIHLRGDGSPPASGSLVLADLVLRPPGRAAVPDGFDAAAWLAGRGIALSATIARDGALESLAGGGPLAGIGAARDRLQTRLRSALAGGLPPRECAIAGGVLLGGGTPGEQRAPFASLGLAHLFALSGLHVGILAGLCLLALRPLGTGPTGRLLVLGPLLATYVVLVDLPGSVVRAGGLVTLALVGPVAGRRLDSLRILGLLLWVNVCWQPAALLDTGTRLSYQAAGGIVAFQRLLGPWLATRPRWQRGIAAGLGVTVSAQLATLPEVARAFGFLPLTGPLANLLLVPVFALAVTLLAAGLAVTLLWPWAGEAVLAVAWLLLRPLEAFTAAAAAGGLGCSVGLASWGPMRGLAFGGLVGALVLALRRRRRGSLLVAGLSYAAILGLAVWRPGPHGAVDAWQFAVGQGDAALLRLPDGWTCLVDTGEAWRGGGGPLARDVLPFLRRHGIGRLDGVVLTHGHADHTGGCEALAAALAVGTWYTGGSALPGPGPHVRPVAGDTLHAAAGWSLICLHPGRPTEPDQAPDAHENDRSVVLGLCRDGRLRGLWPGDLERGGEVVLLPRLPPVPETGLDVLKAGHHGSATSASAPLLECLRPRLVVISCGVANRHGHPSHGPYVAAAETLAIGRTDLQGTVHLRWEANGRLRIRTQRRLPMPASRASLDTPRAPP